MSYSLLYCKILPESINLAIGSIKDPKNSTYDFSEEELAEYQAIKSSTRRKEFISTRHLIKEISTRIGYLSLDFSIKKDKLGKPYAMADGRHIFLSIAHSNDLVACGISETRDLGIDLEPLGRKVPEGLENRILHPEEYAGLKSQDLLQIWTIKEALVKLEGGGLRTNLNGVIISKLDENEYLGRFNNDKTARICSFQHNQHWISVAYY